MNIKNIHYIYIQYIMVNRWLYKYEITFITQGETICRKFKSLNEFLSLYGDELNLNRQKCYRIRKKQFSTKTGTSATGLKKYSGLIITDIREEIKSKYVRTLVT